MRYYFIPSQITEPAPKGSGQLLPSTQKNGQSPLQDMNLAPHVQVRCMLLSEVNQKNAGGKYVSKKDFKVLNSIRSIATLVHSNSVRRLKNTLRRASPTRVSHATRQTLCFHKYHTVSLWPHSQSASSVTFSERRHSQTNRQTIELNHMKLLFW